VYQNFKAVAAVPSSGANAFSYSINGVYCGSAALPGTTGMLPTGGYTTMKMLCQGASGCTATAHMCTTEEMLRSAATGGIPSSVTDGWYSSGVAWVDPSSANAVSTDCNGWRTNSNTREGAAWTGGQPNSHLCSNNSNVPILCCD
jgi:hypothetical protein